MSDHSRRNPKKGNCGRGLPDQETRNSQGKITC